MGTPGCQKSMYPTRPDPLKKRQYPTQTRRVLPGSFPGWVPPIEMSGKNDDIIPCVVENLIF